MFLPSKRSSFWSLLVLLVVTSHAVAHHEIVGDPPMFTNQEEPSDKVVFENDAQENKINLVLRCPVTGDPQPNVTWFMGDDVMVNSQYVMDDGRLVIPNITEGQYASRTGVPYYCLASNTIGRPELNYTATIRSRTANVTYAFFDGFTEDVNPTVNVTVMSNVALRCDVGDANPLPTIQWFDDININAVPATGGLLDPNDDTDNVFYLDGGRYLAINELEQSQINSQYRCHVTNVNTFQRQVSPTIFSLNDNLPANTLVDYKQIGDVTAFVTDNEVEFSYIGGSSGLAPGIFSQCQLFNGTESLETLTSLRGIGSIEMDEIPTPTLTSNEFPIQCQIGSSAATATRSGTLSVYRRATITSSPPDNREFVVGEEETIPFTCMVDGIPAPEVEWYINGEEVRSDNANGISIQGNTLTIAQPNPSHSGMYQCFVSNEFATDLASWVLEVRDPITPNITDFNFTELGAVEDRDFGAVLVEPLGTENVEFFARVDADPCPGVQWSLNGTDIMNSSDYVISNPCLGGGSSPYTFTLTITNLTEVTSGNYSAVFTSLNQEVVLPRTFITIPRQVSIQNMSLSLQGQETRSPCLLNNSVAILRCNVAGFPRPEIYFFRGSARVEPGEPPFERYSMPFFDELQINDVDMEDDNNGFTCRDAEGTSMADEEFSFCTRPTIVNYTQTDKPLLGSNFFVECSLVGVPRVNVAWFKDGQQLVSSEADGLNIVIPQRAEGDPISTSRVEVTDAATENDGRYTCTGTNDAGEATMNFQIQSQDPNDGLALPLPAIIGIAAGGAGGIILIVLVILLIVCVYQCALRSRKASMDMPPPYSGGRMYTDYSDGRGNVDDSDGEDGQPEAFNPQYESLPALRPSQPPGYKPTPSYPHGVGDDLEMVKIPPPDTDSFVGGAPPYMHQDNGLPSSSYRPTVDDFVSEDAQFV